MRCRGLGKECRLRTLEGRKSEYDKHFLETPSHRNYERSINLLLQDKGITNGGRAQNREVRRLVKQAVEPLILNRAWKSYSEFERKTAVWKVTEFFHSKFDYKSLSSEKWAYG